MSRSDKRMLGLLTVNAVFLIAALITAIMAIASVFKANWPHALGYAVIAWFAHRIFMRLPTE